MRRQIGDARIIVDAGGRQLAAVAAVDRLHPLHADDRIQAQFGERTAHVDIARLHEQRVGQTIAQLVLQGFERDHLRGGVGRSVGRGRCRGDERHGDRRRRDFAGCVRAHGIDPQPADLHADRAFAIAQIDVDAVRIAQPRPGVEGPGTGREREHVVDGGRRQRRAGRGGPGDQRDADLQCGFERGRMQMERGRTVHERRGHAHVRQPLARIRLHGVQTAQAVAIAHAAGGETRIQGVRRGAGIAHARTQRRQIDTRRRGQRMRHGLALEEQSGVAGDGFVRGQDVEYDAAVVLRRQCDPQRGRGLRRSPVQSAQFERVAVVCVGKRMRDRGAGHFQTSGSGQRTHRDAIARVLDKMERIIAEARIVALAGEVGSVGMQQWMQRGTAARRRFGARIAERVGTGIQPMPFLGEGITRQAETLRHGVDRGETVPRQIETLDPQIGQPRQLATRNPLGDDAAEIGIGRQRSERIAVGADLAASVTVARSGGLLQTHMFKSGLFKIRSGGAQLDLQFGHAAGQDRKSLVHRLTPGLQGVSDVVQAQSVLLARIEEDEEFVYAAQQLFRRACGDRQQRLFDIARGARRGGVFGDHQMAIGAAEAEGVDRGAAHRAGRYRPVAQTVVDVERTAIECDVPVELAEMDGRRQLAMLQRKQHLEHARHTGCGEAVADIGLDRTERAVARVLRIGFERRFETGHFDRVAERGAGAVRFDQLDAGRIDTETVVHLALQARLRIGVRRSDAVGPAVLIDPPAFDHAIDAIAVAFGIVQPLEHDHAHAFAVGDAVGAFVEGEAATLRREHADLRSHDLHRRAGHHVDAAGHRHIAAAAEQTVAGGGDGHQRGRTGGVDRKTRAVQIEQIGNARRQDRRRGAGEPLAAELFATRELMIVAGGAADEHAAALTAERFRIVAGVFDAVPAGLQEHPLLGIHAARFTRRDIEERRIEQVVFLQRAHPAAVGLARRDIAGLEVAIDVPAMCGDFIDAVATSGDVAPEGVEIVGPGELPGHADHRDRLRAQRTGLCGIARAPGRQRHDHDVGRRPAGDDRLCDRRRRRRGRDRRLGRDLRQRGGLVHVARELRQRRVAVDLDRFDRSAVMLVDPADPGHAGDRIQTEVDELFVVADLGSLHPQLVREQAAQMRGDGGRTRRDDRCDRRRDRRVRGRGHRRSADRNHCGRSRSRRSDRRCRNRRCRLRGFLAHMPRELRQRRIAVDLDRFDRSAVMLVDPTDPGHAGDRIQTEVDELFVIADLGRFHPQFVREQIAQMRSDGVRIEMLRGWGGTLRSGNGCGRGGRRRRRCRSRGAVRCEPALDARQGVGLADEGLCVHVQLAHISVVQRRAQRRGPALLQRKQTRSRLTRDALRQSQRSRQHVLARQHRLTQTARLEIGAGIILGGKQGFARQIAADAQREHQGGTGARGEAIAHVRTEVAAFLGEQRDVGIHAHRPAGTDAVALHRRDHRQRADQRQLEHHVVGESGAAVVDRQQGVAGAAGGEILVVTGKHDHFVRIALGHVREDILHAAGERGREHVLGLAIGHADFENAARVRDRGDFGIADGQRDRRIGCISGGFGIGIGDDSGRGTLQHRGNGQRFGIATLPVAQRRQRQCGERIDGGQRVSENGFAGLHARNAEGIAQFSAAVRPAAERPGMGTVVAMTQREGRVRGAGKCGIVQQPGGIVMTGRVMDAGIAEERGIPTQTARIGLERGHQRPTEPCSHAPQAFRGSGSLRRFNRHQETGHLAAQHHAARAIIGSGERGLERVHPRLGTALARPQGKNQATFTRGFDGDPLRMRGDAFDDIRHCGGPPVGSACCLCGPRSVGHHAHRSRDLAAQMRLEQTQRGLRFPGEVDRQRHRGGIDGVVRQHPTGPACGFQRRTGGAGCRIQEIRSGGMAEAGAQHGPGVFRQQAAGRIVEGVARGFRADHRVAQRSDQETGAGGVAACGGDDRIRELSERAIQSGALRVAMSGAIAGKEMFGATAQQQGFGVRCGLHRAQRAEQAIDQPRRKAGAVQTQREHAIAMIEQRKLRSVFVLRMRGDCGTERRERDIPGFGRHRTGRHGATRLRRDQRDAARLAERRGRLADGEIRPFLVTLDVDFGSVPEPDTRLGAGSGRLRFVLRRIDQYDASRLRRHRTVGNAAIGNGVVAPAPGCDRHRSATRHRKMDAYRTDQLVVGVHGRRRCRPGDSRVVRPAAVR